MKIVIASGKGGTGKTLVSTNAVSAMSMIREVELIDCDVEEPNSHLFFNTDILKEIDVKAISPKINNNYCIGCKICSQRCEFNALSVVDKQVIFFPELCHSCGGCIFFCPTDAITEGEKLLGKIEYRRADNFDVITGRLEVGSALAPEMIEATIAKADNKKLSIIDSPPGTSCSAIAALSNADYCLLVTEPTPYGLHDLKKAVLVAQRLDVPAGVIINKYQEEEDIITNYCKKENLPILLKIPYSKEIAEKYANGNLSEEISDGLRSTIEKIEGMVGNA
ncbi:MAG: 4Fe-4S binding protein [Clostridia bacterium]